MSLKVTSKMTHTGRHLYKGSSLFYRTEIHRTETVKRCIREQLDPEEQLEIKYVKPPRHCLEKFGCSQYL